MAQQFYVLLNNGVVQPFTFDSNVGNNNPAAIVLGSPIVPDLAPLGLTLSSFKVDVAANKFVGTGSPTSGGSCTAFLFNMNGTIYNSRHVTFSGATSRGIALTPQKTAWITTSRGVFMWPIAGLDSAAIAPQNSTSLNATNSRTCFERPYLLYGALDKLVVHDTQNGETYFMNARRFNVPRTTQNGDNTNFVVFGVRKYNDSVIILWSSSGSIGGNPNQYLTHVVHCNYPRLIEAAKTGGSVTPLSKSLETEGQSWGVWSTNPSNEIILAGRNRGQFRRFILVILPPPTGPSWQATHDYALDDYLDDLTPPMSSSEIKFIDDGQVL